MLATSDVVNAHRSLAASARGVIAYLRDMEFAEHAILAGRYRLERPLGAGAMGEVWEATQLAIGARVAVKRLTTAGAASHEMVTRFRREAQMLGRVRSDYVARLLDFVEDPKYGLALVMELVTGRGLLEIVAERVLSCRETIDLGCDVVSALCDLHAARVIHRDLKPGNLIVRPDRRGGTRAIVVDFGMSRILHQGKDDEITDITRAGVALGTLAYMAPEQMLSSRDVGAAADLYAVGAILYRAAAGRHAYVERDENELARRKLTEEAPRLPTTDDPATEGLAAIVARALRRKSAERYASAEEMLAALEGLRQGSHFFEDDTTTHDHSSAPVLLAAPGPSGSAPLPPETSSDPVSLHAVDRGSGSRPAATSPSAPPAPPRRKLAPIAIGGVAIALIGGALIVRPTGSSAPPPREAIAPSASSPPRASAVTAPASAAPSASAATDELSIEALPTASASAAPRASWGGPLRPPKPVTSAIPAVPIPVGDDGF